MGSTVPGGTTRRKKDIVSLMAITLFAAGLAFEIFVIYKIPALLNQEGRWRKDVAIEELVEMQDLLRAYLTTARDKSKSISAEAGLAKSCLDDYARYLRKNKDSMGAEQTERIFSQLLQFKQLYETGWRGECKGFCSDRNIDAAPFIRLQMERLK